jgi:type VI secretion system secreted protein Hcp
LRRFRLLVLSVVASVFAAFGVVAPAEAAVDYFLEVDGVPGESQDAKMQKAIDLQSFSWGASTDKQKAPSLQNLNVVHNVDAASPVLFQRLVQGTTIPSVELIGRKAGEAQFIFLRFCFEGVRVNSVQQGGSSGGDSPNENVSFSYGAVSEQYTQQRADGTSGNTVFAGWNATQGALIQTYPASCGGS